MDKPSHHARAEALAARLFEPTVVEQAELRLQVTVSMPLGLAAAADELGSYLPKPSRSAGVVELMRLGYGLFVEKLPSDKRKAFASNVEQRLDELAAQFASEEE